MKTHRRKRAIEKAALELERIEDWKEYVRAVGGTVYIDKDGKRQGKLYVD